MTMPEGLKKAGIGALIGLVVGLAIAWGTRVEGFFLTGLLDSYEFRSYDSRMKARVAGSSEASIEDIVVVDIDQASIEGLGNYKDWPHAYHGRLIDVLTSGDPRAILFDIIFDPENSFDFELVDALVRENQPRDPNLAAVTEQFLLFNDPRRFVESTAASGRVYHALVFERADSLNFLYAMATEPEGLDTTGRLLKIPLEQARRLPDADRIGNIHFELLNASRGTGSANFPQDEDGIIRRAPTAIYFKGPQHVYPSLVMAAAMDILKIPRDGWHYDFDNYTLTLSDSSGAVLRTIPIDAQGRMYVNYYGRFKTFYYLPYMYCFDPDMLAPEYWQDKVAIVGSSLPGLMDLRNTPVQETFAGVEIHANVLYSLLNNEFVQPAGPGANFWAILLLSVLLGLVVAIPKPLYSLPVPLLGIIGWVVFTYSQFLTRLVMWEIVRPALALALSYLGVFLYNFLVVEKDKRFLRQTFGTYIAPELIDQMYANKQQPKLGGEEGYYSAFFSDIQSFSSFSEKLSPTELVTLLNEYLTELTDILLVNKGTLDKYIGDAIVAFYGTPAPVENHEYCACLTALQMQKRLAELRDKWRREGDRWPEIVHHMQTRMGINSGPMVTGNMGSTMRMNYTMMGDTVNLAARLEASAKQYGVYIQVAETTYQAVKEQFVWRELDYVRVIGKSEPVNVYELLGAAGQQTAPQARLLAAYQEALALYKSRNWNQALEAFQAAEALEDMFPGRKTNPSRVYQERCRHWQANPPGQDWDGVWTLTSK